MKKKLPLLALAYLLGALAVVVSFAAKVYTRATSHGVIVVEMNCKGGPGPHLV